jgi:adenylate kinase family enzyme
MTTSARLSAVCLIGPPAAGKTTLAQALSESIGARIVRPRDVVRNAVTGNPAVVDLFSRDHRGYVSDESLGFALRVTLDSLNGLTVLKNLPWDAIQLADLHRVAGDSITILHLRASDELVIGRKGGRLYCDACYPRPAADGGAGRCTRCGGTLNARLDDAHDAFQARLQLHRINAAGILALALKLRVPVVTLEATHSPDELAGRARAAIGRQRWTRPRAS